MAVITVITFATFNTVNLVPSFPVAFNAPAPSSVPTASLVPSFLIPAVADTWDKKEIINLWNAKVKILKIPYWFTKGGKIKKYSVGSFKDAFPYFSEEIAEIIDKPLFRCCECGEILPISEMEYWRGENEENDLINGELMCGCCYEAGMGEDL